MMAAFSVESSRSTKATTRRRRHSAGNVKNPWRTAASRRSTIASTARRFRPSRWRSGADAARPVEETEATGVTAADAAEGAIAVGAAVGIATISAADRLPTWEAASGAR
jgi:hypothetical protein